MQEVRYMISDAADKLQMEAHVLRYWEEELELDVPRNEMGHRYYTEEWLETFRQICLLKKQGYQLRAIKMLLHKKEHHDSDLFMEIEANGICMPVEMNQWEQFQMFLSAAVKDALAENTQELGQAVGEEVEKKLQVLFHEQEERQEERFRRLDEILRTKQQDVKQKRSPGFLKKQQEKLRGIFST